MLVECIDEIRSPRTFPHHTIAFSGKDYTQMGSAIVNLLPLMIGSALVPSYVIVVLMLIRNSQGLLKASAYVGGMTAIRLVQGAIFGPVLNGSDKRGSSNELKTIVSVLLLVIGIVMLATAGMLLLKGEDPDAPPPRWMKMIDSISPIVAFGIGAVWLLFSPKPWVFMLSSLAVIQEAGLETAQSILAFLIFVFGAEILLIVPIIVCAVAPKRSDALLTTAVDWLEQYSRVIVIVVSLTFGTFFLWKGISALLG